jgi:hypothetical protein
MDWCATKAGQLSPTDRAKLGKLGSCEDDASSGVVEVDLQIEERVEVGARERGPPAIAQSRRGEGCGKALVVIALERALLRAFLLRVRAAGERRSARLREARAARAARRHARA